MKQIKESLDIKTDIFDQIQKNFTRQPFFRMNSTNIYPRRIRRYNSSRIFNNTISRRIPGFNFTPRYKPTHQRFNMTIPRFRKHPTPVRRFNMTAPKFRRHHPRRFNMTPPQFRRHHPRRFNMTNP